jgi:hypothetical protein
VPILRSVDLYPQTGWREQPWADTPAQDAMVRTARRVCESLNAKFSTLGLQAPRARTQLLTSPSDHAGLQVLLFEDPLDHNIGEVLVPAQAREWLPQQRAAALVDGLEAAFTLLGARHGWDPDTLADAFTEIRRSASRYRWVSSRWRTSLDRRSKARLLGELRDNGFGVLVLELQDRTGETCFSPVLDSYSTPEGFTRTAATLEWLDETHVTLDPEVDFLGRSDGSVLLAISDFTADNPLQQMPAHEGAFEAPAVSQAHWRPEVPEALEHVAVSFGLGLGVPRQVEKTMLKVNTELTDLYRDWLASAGIRHLEYFYEFDTDARTGIQVRDRRPTIHIFQRRALAELPRDPQECDRTIRRDIQDALDRLANKLGTGTAPRLPLT